MVKYIILGATGSIGTQTLDIIKENQDRLVAFTYGNNLEQAIKIISEFTPLYVGCKNVDDEKVLKDLFPTITFFSGEDANNKIASLYQGDAKVVNALVGSVGLEPTTVAIKTNHDILLANKETLVIGGSIVKSLAKEHNVKIIPIDSEHSAIYQLLLGHNKREINKIILTASGGSLRNVSKEDLEHVTVEQALKHPNWSMGKKITIDSSTMMNKGFEVIEAYHLFELDESQIDVIIHPESIIHSMVEFKDYSIFAQLATSSMHLPINYAINGPIHKSCDIIQPLDFSKFNALHFEKIDMDRFVLVKLAYDAIKKGGYYPTILNASNEAAVNLFLEKKIKFTDIEKIILDEFNNPKYQNISSELNVQGILDLDKQIKKDINNKYR